MPYVLALAHIVSLWESLYQIVQIPAHSSRRRFEFSSDIFLARNQPGHQKLGRQSGVLR